MARTPNSSAEGEGKFDNLFAEEPWRSKFPPILTLDETVELLQVPKATIYTWSSQGLLKNCSFRAGKHLRIYRDKLLQKLTNGELYGS